MSRPQPSRVLIASLAAAIVIFYGWAVAAWSPLPRLFGEPQPDGYNVVAEGWFHGRIRLGARSDSLPAGSGVEGAAYFDGPYRGNWAAPAAALFLPWRMLTGFDLPVPYAALIFASAGFLLSVVCWLRIRARFFSDSGMLAPACCIPAIGLAVMGHSALFHPGVAEVAIAAGYSFAMGALACVIGPGPEWSASEATAWAGLLLAFAAASNPLYALALPLLAAPALGWPRRKRDLEASCWGAAAFAVGAAAFLEYNRIRFGSVLDFGLPYRFMDRSAAGRRYLIDFAPMIVLLAAFGYLFIEREARFGWRRRWGLGLAGALAALAASAAVVADYDVLFRLQQDDPRAGRLLSGWLEGTVRVGERLTGLGYGPLEIDLRFPRGKERTREPLVSTGWLMASDNLFVEYLPDHRRIRLGFDHAGYGVRWSAPFAVDFQAVHTLRVEMGSLYPPAGYPFFAGRSPAEVASLAGTLRVTLDGRVLLERTQEFHNATPESLRIGYGGSVAHENRFSGTIVAVRRTGYRWLEPRRGVFGPVVMEVVFPTSAADRRFPLVTSGVAGRGNAVYVRIERDGRARFGYDHWGVGGFESDPVSYNPAAAHRIEIRYGALLPPPRTAAERAKRDFLTVKLDGKLAWKRKVPYYAASAATIVVGRNLAGFSTCEHDFAGAILATDYADSEDDPLAPGPLAGGPP